MVFRKDRGVTDTTVKVKTAIPAYRTMRTITEQKGVGAKSALHFSPDSPGNPSQQVIPGTNDD